VRSMMRCQKYFQGLALRPIIYLLYHVR
jgi:hypothetical protein